MKFYLSSFKLGDKPSELSRLMGKKRKIAYIPNACDYTNVDWDRRNNWEKQDIQSLKDLGLSVEYLDLKKYFGKTDQLRKNWMDLVGYLSGAETLLSLGKQ